MTIFRSLILMLFPLIFSCAGSNPSAWKPYFFDGSSFVAAEDNGAKTVWTRSGHYPLTSEPPAGDSDRLPSGTGAVAGICYLQTSGGKLAPAAKVTPYADEQITFKNKDEGVYVTRTDKNGYFAEYLPAGNYEVFCRGARMEISIKRGETTLVPIRGGKRMAD